MLEKYLFESIPERIVRRIYRKSSDELRTLLELKKSQEIEFISYWEECKNNMVFASDNIKSLDKAIICGGPCIDHCNGDIGKLRINILVDIIWPIVAALRLNLPCCLILYIPDELDTMNQDYERIKQWSEIGDRLEKIAYSLAISLGVKKIQICRTDDKRVLNNFSKWTDILNKNYEDLNDIYTLGLSNKEFNERTSNIEPWLKLRYERNMMLYFPQFISECVEEKYNSIITVENIHQGMAISKAKKILKKIDATKSLYHIAYVTPPSLTCKTRMSRSKNAMIFIENSKDEMISLFNSALKAPKIYWNNCLPREINTVLNFKNSIEFFDAISKDICKSLVKQELA